MAKKEVPEDEGPSQEWLASYADAMTLLLAFFIMMFAFALIDEGKFFDFKVGVVAALGIPDPLTDNTDSILEKGTGISPEVGLTPLRPSNSQKLSLEETVEMLSEAGEVTEENAEDLAQLLELELELAGAGEVVEVGIDERGVFIRFKDQILFASGSADMEENGPILLSIVAEVLEGISNTLEVEGHTDSEPTNGGAWPSNWELSGVRAAGVLRYLIDPGDIPDERLSFIGLADTNSIATNNTAEGRAANRRVEIVVRLAKSEAEKASEISQAVDGASPDSTPADSDGTSDPIDSDPINSEAADPDPGDIDPIGDPIGLPAVPEEDE